ncbi:unnamed protein product [Caenorhabditis bovis]|uniref:Carboxylic ester hydrolase n=1 Tax=Caenorhabditis bovis TaxID=2654633 RepID=A0A8S1EZM5_9PELO|nr:unnamed protein product [Caenorhabditis bovis]
MRSSIKFIFVLFFCLSFGTYSLKIIETSFGKLRGITDYSDQNNRKHIFKSVPFAQPPVGKLRFEIPQSPKKWKGVRDASKYSPACAIDGTITSYHPEKISEDCLYLNIFTSEKCLNQSCPVIVYFHGGAFSSDSAVMFPDEFILERYVGQGVVFVIPAMRLGVFGLFNLDNESETPKNLLVHDCVSALKYVHSEIRNFGGDPKKVTIMGHSSGAILTQELGLSMKIDPEMKLFQQAISLSGYLAPAEEQTISTYSLEITDRLGCYSIGSRLSVIKECMKLISTEDLLKAQKDMQREGRKFNTISLGEPFADETKTRRENLEKVPPRRIMIGSTEYEFGRFDAKESMDHFADIENPEEVTQKYIEDVKNNKTQAVHLSNVRIFLSAIMSSTAVTNSGGEAYIYETRQKPFSGHISDMIYFIGIHGRNMTDDEKLVDSVFTKMLVNFTKMEAPLSNFEPFDPSRSNFLALEFDTENGIKPHMEDDYHEEIVDYWFINMTQFDLEVSRQKGQKKKLTTKPTNSITTQTTTSDSVSANLSWTETTNTIIIEASTIGKIKESSESIISQWWFYLIIVLVILIVICLFYTIKQCRKDEERRPLLLD